MRRAILATAASLVGLAALLDYKPGSTIHISKTSISGGSLSASGLKATSTTASPSSSAPTIPAPAVTTTPTTQRSSSTQVTSPPTTQAPAPPTTVRTGTSGTFTGPDIQYNYGDIQVRITVVNGKITNITIPQESATDPRSQSINSQAVPILTQEVLAAQSLNVNVVSGATFTSEAFGQSIQPTLTQAGL